MGRPKIYDRTALIKLVLRAENHLRMAQSDLLYVRKSLYYKSPSMVASIALRSKCYSRKISDLNTGTVGERTFHYRENRKAYRERVKRRVK